MNELSEDNYGKTGIRNEFLSCSYLPKWDEGSKVF